MDCLILRWIRKLRIDLQSGLSIRIFIAIGVRLLTLGRSIIVLRLFRYPLLIYLFPLQLIDYFENEKERELKERKEEDRKSRTPYT